MKKYNVVLGLSILTILELIGFARFVHDMMKGNAFFPDPPVPLDEFLKLAQELEDAYLAAQDGGKEATKLMYQKRTELEIKFKVLGNYVENVALLDNDNGEVIINSAGMDIKRPGGGGKQQFTAENTGISGRVRLTARSGGAGVSYIWEYSTDGGKTWIKVNGTSIANKVIDGLEPGLEHYFRGAIVIGEEAQAYQGPAILIVT